MTNPDTRQKIAHHYDTKVKLGNRDLNQRITDGVIVHHHEGLVSEAELSEALLHKDNNAWLEAFIYHKEMGSLQSLLFSTGSTIQQAHYIFDAGCGRGGASIQLASTYSAHILGVSLSPKQIEFGKQSVDKLGLSEKVELRIGDMLHTGIDDETFDFILVLGSSEHVTDLVQMSSEFKRLAKKGAYILIYTWTVNNDHPLAHYYKQQVDNWYETDLHSRDEYSNALISAGWSIVHSEDLSQEGARYWSVRKLLKDGSGSESFMTPGFNKGALGYQLLIARNGKASV